MGEALRRFEAYDGADAARLNAIYGALTAKELLTLALRRSGAGAGFGRVALVSSFGAESAVLLHMAAGIDRGAPVLLADTGKLFPETLAYAERLTAMLGLRLERARPDAAALAARDPQGLRWSYDPDGCCALRKADPLAASLDGFDLWVSGRKRAQAATRAAMPFFEADPGVRRGMRPRLKLNPLARWTADRLAIYAREHGLPPHPLVAEGYASIGCAPCTARVQPGEDPRAGRWRGWDKVECGIHKPGDEPAF